MSGDPPPRRRRGLVVAPLVAVAAAGAIIGGAVLTSHSSAGPPVRSAVPFTLDPVVQGQPSATVAADPGRPVLLTFFAAWCGPCTRELPLMEAVAQRSQRPGPARSGGRSDTGPARSGGRSGPGPARSGGRAGPGPDGRGAPEVVGVDFMDQRADAADLLRHAGVMFPTGFDRDGSVGQRWHVDGLPITVLISPDGRVLAYHRGELRQRQLDRLLERLPSS